MVVFPFRSAMALVAGLCLWVAFPDVDLPWLAPVGVALAASAVRGTRVRTGAVLGLLCGLAWFMPYVSWVGSFIGPVPWLSLALLQALFVAAFGAVATTVRPGRWEPVTVAAWWSVAEWGRASFPFGGFPWGRVAYSQADTPLVGLAALGGPALVGFAVALVGTLLAAGVRSLRAGSGKVALLHACLAGLLVVAPMAVPRPVDGRQVTVMAVQGGAQHSGLAFNIERRQLLDNHVRETVRAAGEVAAGRSPRPDLVVWPENASDIDPFVARDAGAGIDAAVRAIGAPTLVGAVLGGGRNDLTNTTILWRPGVGATDERYDKRELVPFGEYIPHRAVFRALTRQVDLLERDFVPGERPGVIEVPARDGTPIRAGLAICFEVAIDHVVDDTVANGADLLVVQTNNAMFGLTAESVQQLAISRVRAVEYGRSVVHASNVGVSALITPDGAVHHPTAHFAAASVVDQVPLRTQRTLASLIGPSVDVLLALIALAGAIQPLPSRRR